MRAESGSHSDQIGQADFHDRLIVPDKNLDLLLSGGIPRGKDDWISLGRYGRFQQCSSFGKGVDECRLVAHLRQKALDHHGEFDWFFKQSRSRYGDGAMPAVSLSEHAEL